MNKKILKIIILATAIVVMLALIIINNSNKQKVNNVQEKAKSTDASVEVSSTLLKEETSDTIVENTQSEIEELMIKYYDTSKEVDKNLIESQNKNETEQTVDSITEKREGIESYQNVTSYVKPGLEVDTYVVYSSYDMKFYNIDTLAPGMSVLYVAKDENGTFAILDKPEDDQLNQYIDQLSKEDEIVKLIDDVNTRLAVAIKKDEALKTFVESLEKVIKTDKK